jgi:hypothetical protein
MAQKRSLSSANAPLSPAQDIFRSNTVEDRKSTFTALFSTSTPARALQALPEVRSASHRIAAWRTPSRQATLDRRQLPTPFTLASDDDGEQWAGKRLERVLADENVVGTVVVARWYGGVLLGPARFRWIEQVAREAIHRFKEADAKQSEELLLGRKRAKVGGDDESLQATAHQGAATTMQPREIQKARNALIEELKNRDQNIVVLRNLLEEKKAKMSDPGGSPKPVSPAKIVDYNSISLTRLQALDKARDATVAFLLKELDVLDKKHAEDDEVEEAFRSIQEPKGKDKGTQNHDAKDFEGDVIEEAWNMLDDAINEKPKQ